MQEILEYSKFAACVNEAFEIADSGVTLQLVECNRLKSVPGEPREPFSLMFRGPQNPFLQQKIYALKNPQLGPVEIFLVPVGRIASGFLYEAVFN